MKSFEGDLSFDAFENHLYRELSRIQSVSDSLIQGNITSNRSLNTDLVLPPNDYSDASLSSRCQFRSQ